MSCAAARRDAGERALARPSSGRAYFGLGLFGWGLSILLDIAPHEDPVVGAALAGFGATLLLTAPRLPAVGKLPAWIVGGAGLAAIVFVLVYDAIRRSALDAPKTLILALGALGVASAPFLTRSLPLRHRGERVRVATLVASSCVALGAPVLVWGVQALFEGLIGSTPIEAFVHYALIWPLWAFLMLLGWHPIVSGQNLTYTTPRDQLNLEVGAACSGVQAMALFSAVLALFLIVERPSGKRLAAWAAIGILGVYVANLLRLFALSLVGWQWGVDALLQVHAQAGWVFFVAWALGFAWLARRSMPAREPRTATPAPMPD